MTAFTPDEKLDLLFDPSLIPLNVKAALPADFHMRPLALTDHSRSHLAVLSVLTSAPHPGVEAYEAHFNSLRTVPNTYFVIVTIHKPTDQIVAVGSLFLEKKFIRNLGSVGHIEDGAVNKHFQRHKLGLKMIHALTSISETCGAYKNMVY